MKTMNRIFSYCIILIFSISLIACSGSDGTDGVDGVDGTIGPQGPAGVDGQNGVDGNANVISSGWLDANWNVTDDPTTKVMRIPITELSQSDLSNSTLVMVYLKQYGTSSIYTMPSAGRWFNTWYSFTFGDSTSNYDGILITLKSTDGVALTEYQATAYRGNKFRYILIPSNSATASTGKSALNYSNYKEVLNYYHLND